MQKFSEERHKPTLTTTKVADLLGCSVPTVKRLAERGELAGFKIGYWYKFVFGPVPAFQDLKLELDDSQAGACGASRRQSRPGPTLIWRRPESTSRSRAVKPSSRSINTTSARSVKRMCCRTMMIQSTSSRGKSSRRCSVKPQFLIAGIST